MTFRQLMAFSAMARHMNITKAARELRTSQPGLSKQLKSLHDDYGVRFFTRNGKRIELTEEGFELLNHINPILAQLEKIDQRFSRKFKRSSPTQLTIGGTHEVSSSILASLSAVFKKRYPNVELVLRSNTIHILEQMILNGDIEIGLTSVPPRSSVLRSESCTPLKLAVFDAKEFRIANHSDLALEDLAKLPLVIRDNRDGRGPIETVVRKLREQGYRPNIAMRCESPEAIKAAVSKQVGVGILFEVLIQEELKRGTFKQLNVKDFSAEGSTYVLSHKERPLSACADAFLKILKDFCDVMVHRSRKQTNHV